MRKSLISALILFFVIFSSALLGYATTKDNEENAQNAEKKKKGPKVEMSTSIYFDIHKEWSDRYEYSDTITEVILPMRIGIFLTKNLEIEPEWTYIYGGYNSSSSESFLFDFINISLNFSTESQVRPFILAGLGMVRLITKGIAVIPEGSLPDLQEVGWNIGAGIKWFVAKKIALRFDYRFINYARESGGEDIFDYHSHHKLYFGVSFFFN